MAQVGMIVIAWEVVMVGGGLDEHGLQNVPSLFFPFCQMTPSMNLQNPYSPAITPAVASGCQTPSLWWCQFSGLFSPHSPNRRTNEKCRCLSAAAGERTGGNERMSETQRGDCFMPDRQKDWVQFWGRGAGTGW